VAAELQAQGSQSPFKLVVDPVLVSTSGDALATAGVQCFEQAAARPSCHSLTAPWPAAAPGAPPPAVTPLSTLSSPHPDLATHALPHHNTAALPAGVVEAIKRHMLPLATIVTPNLPEACKLLGGALACLYRLPAGWWRPSVGPACAGTCWTCPASCLHAACCLQPACRLVTCLPAAACFPAWRPESLHPPLLAPPLAAEGRSITDVEGMRAAAEELHHYGPQASALSVALLPVAAR
jgi:hypothetical protein